MNNIFDLKKENYKQNFSLEECARLTKLTEKIEKREAEIKLRIKNNVDISTDLREETLALISERNSIFISKLTSNDINDIDAVWEKDADIQRIRMKCFYDNLPTLAEDVIIYCCDFISNTVIQIICESDTDKQWQLQGDIMDAVEAALNVRKYLLNKYDIPLFSKEEDMLYRSLLIEDVSGNACSVNTACAAFWDVSTKLKNIFQAIADINDIEIAINKKYIIGVFDTFTCMNSLLLHSLEKEKKREL